MTATAKQKKIDDLMKKASESLAQTAYFEAERMALKALQMARQEGDFERMARIVMPLMEARRQRYQQALDVGSVTIVNAPVSEDMKFERGCYIVQPPQVGADARRLRLAALSREIPVAVVCREPLSQLRLQPIVAISPGVTLRSKVAPPKPMEQPSMQWLAEALEALGNDALDHLDPALTEIRRIDALLDRLDALPEHEELHMALELACREAHKAGLSGTRPGGASGRALQESLDSLDAEEGDEEADGGEAVPEAAVVDDGDEDPAAPSEPTVSADEAEDGATARPAVAASGGKRRAPAKGGSSGGAGAAKSAKAGSSKAGSKRRIKS